MALCGTQSEKVRSNYFGVVQRGGFAHRSNSDVFLWLRLTFSS